MLQKVSKYLRDKLPDNFVGWTNEALEDYVLFHIEQNTLMFAINDNDEVRGVVIGWKTKNKELKPWTWQKPDEDGKYWYWDQLAADNTTAVMACCAAMFMRHPEAAVLPAYGVRNGKLRDIDIGIKIYKKGEELYGSNSTSANT